MFENEISTEQLKQIIEENWDVKPTTINLSADEIIEKIKEKGWTLSSENILDIYKIYGSNEESSMEEVEKIYNEFWKGIIENEDGSLNKEQIMKELYDYYYVMDNCSAAYDLMSCGIISKPNTCFSAVRGLFEENYIKKDFAKDDLINCVLCKEMTYEEIIEAIRDYFN